MSEVVSDLYQYLMSTRLIAIDKSDGMFYDLTRYMPIETASHANEICTKPKELLQLYLQWKETQPDLLAERRIIEPLRIFTFGIYLAQETYPFSKKFPYPPIKIDQTGEVTSAAVLCVSNRVKEIVFNKSWLINPTGGKSSSTSTPAFENEGAFILISAGVEEYAHWILHKAIERRRSSIYIASLDTHYDKTLGELDRSINLVNAGLTEIGQTGWLRAIYLMLIGKMGQRIRNVDAELNRAKLALLEHSNTIEEYMGVVWRNAVAQKYFPWTSTAKNTIDKLANAASLKRERATKSRSES